MVVVAWLVSAVTVVVMACMMIPVPVGIVTVVVVPPVMVAMTVVIMTVVVMTVVAMTVVAVVVMIIAADGIGIPFLQRRQTCIGIDPIQKFLYAATVIFHLSPLPSC